LDTIFIDKNSVYMKEIGYGLLDQSDRNLNDLYAFGHPNKG
jgi:hypothetical protein